jgi:hypothetical protein
MGLSHTPEGFNAAVATPGPIEKLPGVGYGPTGGETAEMMEPKKFVVVGPLLTVSADAKAVETTNTAPKAKIFDNIFIISPKHSAKKERYLATIVAPRRPEGPV